MSSCELLNSRAIDIVYHPIPRVSTPGTCLCDSGCLNSLLALHDGPQDRHPVSGWRDASPGRGERGTHEVHVQWPERTVSTVTLVELCNRNLFIMALDLRFTMCVQLR